MPSGLAPIADNSRKKPRQRRSAATVDTIIQATIQLIVRKPAAPITTNKIAQLAGVSVGTLYQYFPNKESIFVAVAIAESTQTADTIASYICTSRGADVDGFISGLIELVSGDFARRALVRRELFRLLGKLDRVSPFVTATGQVTDMITERLLEFRRPDARALNSAEQFVLGRSLTGCMRAAVIEGQQGIDSSDFKDALVRLLLGLVNAT